jgi:hypothetical protein
MEHSPSVFGVSKEEFRDGRSAPEQICSELGVIIFGVVFGHAESPIKVSLQEGLRALAPQRFGLRQKAGLLPAVC